MKKKVLAFGMALAMLLTATGCCDIRDGGSGGKTELNEPVEVPEAGPVASGDITGAVSYTHLGGIMIPSMEEEGYDPGFASSISPTDVPAATA